MFCYLLFPSVYKFVRDCQQITFVTLIGFCPLSKKAPTPSAVIIFLKSLELQSAVSEIENKKNCHKFSFFNRFAQTPHPLNGQIC